MGRKIGKSGKWEIRKQGGQRSAVRVENRAAEAKVEMVLNADR
jgi:hypothetical protein